MPNNPAVDDFAEVLTGAGRGAVAVIRIHCQQLSALHPASSLFRSVGGKSLAECRINRITYGDWRGEDVVVVRTKLTEWEVSCHGGSVPIQRILSDLAKAGIFSRDSVSVQSTNRSQGEWLSLLQHCKTIPTADLILGQPAALRRFAHDIRIARKTEQTESLVERFLGWTRLVKHLVEPWDVAIAGRPNAGKSSLLNAIVGYQRSIVFDQPGTTRDAVQCDVVVGGWPVRFTDTAGIRNQSDDVIEQQGISVAKQAIQQADLSLIVVDQSDGWTDADQELLELAERAGTAGIIGNKVDLVEHPRASTFAAAQSVKCFDVSAKTGHGLPELLNWVAESLVPLMPAFDEPLPVLSSLRTVCQQFLRDGDFEALIDHLDTTLAEFPLSEAIT